MAGCGSIERAADMQAGPIQNVRVKHSRGDILVTEQLLHRSNVVSVLEHMRRKAVSPRKSYTHTVGLIGFLFR
jgi:hypothetical protein